MYTYIPISPSSQASLPPSLSHPYRSSQSMELISLCYAAASRQPSILHLVVYICHCYSLTSSYNFSLMSFQHLFLFFNKFIYLFIYLFIYFWLCWVFVSVRRLSLVAASGGYSSLQCAGFSLSWLLLLWSTGSTRAGSVVVAHGLSCSAACGIFPDQGSNPCPLHWQADS